MLLGVLKGAAGREWRGAAHVLADIGAPAAKPLLELVKHGDTGTLSRVPSMCSV